MGLASAYKAIIIGFTLQLILEFQFLLNRNRFPVQRHCSPTIDDVMKVLYVINVFPTEAETSVINEINALDGLGLPLQLY